MPYRIICVRIVPAMKPYELVYTLMTAQGLGSTDLAKKIGQPKQQPNIHKFMHGGVREPSIVLAQPIATYFGMPIEAMYYDKDATAWAKANNIEAIPVPEPKRRRLGSAWLEEAFAKLPPAEQERMLKRWAKRKPAAPTKLPPLGGLSTNFDILTPRPPTAEDDEEDK